MPFLGSGGSLSSLSDVDTSGASPGDVLVFQAGGTWATAASPPPGPHTHDASDIISGVLANSRLYDLTSVSTTDATPTTIATIVPGLDTTVQCEVYIQARRTGGIAGSAGDGANLKRSFRIKNVGGTVTVSLVQSDFTQRDQFWTLQAVESAGNILVRVVGAVDNDINWQSSLRTFVL